MVRMQQHVRQLYAMCATAIVEGRANLDGADEVGFDIALPMFSVGLTAEIAQIHPQTLRQYDRLGLVVPERTEGGSRRYSLRDIQLLTRAQHLSIEVGVNLTGIARILELEEENRQLRRQVKRLSEPHGSFFAADADGEVVTMSQTAQGRGRRTAIHAKTRQLTGRSHGHGHEASATSTTVVPWPDYDLNACLYSSAGACH